MKRAAAAPPPGQTEYSRPGRPSHSWPTTNRGAETGDDGRGCENMWREEETFNFELKFQRIHTRTLTHVRFG